MHRVTEQTVMMMQAVPLLQLLAPISAFTTEEDKIIIATALNQMPHLLELCSGTGSIGKVFAAAGWKVTSVDLEARLEPTLCMNVLNFEPSMIEGPVDLLWGSPPCTFYSKARTVAKKHGI